MMATLRRFEDSIQSSLFVALTATIVMDVTVVVSLRALNNPLLHGLSYFAQRRVGTIENFNKRRYMAGTVHRIHEYDQFCAYCGEMR